MRCINKAARRVGRLNCNFGKLGRQLRRRRDFEVRITDCYHGLRRTVLGRGTVFGICPVRVEAKDPWDHPPATLSQPQILHRESEYLRCGAVCKF